MKQLLCRDAGFDCDAVVTAETEEEVLARAAPHAQEVHGVEVTPEIGQELAGKIRDV